MSDGDLSALLTFLAIPAGGLIAAGILWAMLRPPKGVTMNTDPTLKPDRTADWYMDVVWPLLPVPGEFDGMDACDQFRWRSVVRLAIEYVLCGERGVPPGSKTPHCPKGDGPCIRGCKGWECRDGWPDDPTLKPDIAALQKRLAEDPGFAAEVTGDKPPTPGCHTPEGCRKNGCLGWCDEHKPEGPKP